MVSVTANRDCSWSVRAEATWIVPEQTTGQGEGVLAFRVQPNGSVSSRRAALVIEGVRIDVSQEGVPCSYALDATEVNIGAAGGTAEVRITTIDGCGWNAQSSVSWITIARNASGSRSEVVALTVAANSGGVRRGGVTIAGQSVTVVQGGVTAPPAPGPSPAPAPPIPAPSPGPSPAPAPAPSPSPGPAPTPAPAPAPQPPPTPPLPSVELTGPVASLSGECPAITFAVNGTSVFATTSTEYRGGNCKRLEEGSDVLVTGERQPDGRVRATFIDLKPR